MSWWSQQVYSRLLAGSRRVCPPAFVIRQRFGISDDWWTQLPGRSFCRRCLGSLPTKSIVRLPLSNGFNWANKQWWLPRCRSPQPLSSKYLYTFGAPRDTRKSSMMVVIRTGFRKAFVDVCVRRCQRPAAVVHRRACATSQSLQKYGVVLKIRVLEIIAGTIIASNIIMPISSRSQAEMRCTIFAAWYAYRCIEWAFRKFSSQTRSRRLPRAITNRWRDFRAIDIASMRGLMTINSCGRAADATGFRSLLQQWCRLDTCLKAWSPPDGILKSPRPPPAAGGCRASSGRQWPFQYGCSDCRSREEERSHRFGSARQPFIRLRPVFRQHGRYSRRIWQNISKAISAHERLQDARDVGLDVINRQTCNFHFITSSPLSNTVFESSIVGKITRFGTKNEKGVEHSVASSMPLDTDKLWQWTCYNRLGISQCRGMVSPAQQLTNSSSGSRQSILTGQGFGNNRPVAPLGQQPMLSNTQDLRPCHDVTAAICRIAMPQNKPHDDTKGWRALNSSPLLLRKAFAMIDAVVRNTSSCQEKEGQAHELIYHCSVMVLNYRGSLEAMTSRVITFINQNKNYAATMIPTVIHIDGLFDGWSADMFITSVSRCVGRMMSSLITHFVISRYTAKMP